MSRINWDPPACGSLDRCAGQILTQRKKPSTLKPRAR
ncbi:hypothetical protein CGRA01v4_10830 [Colletotrichum graminicola]|nr:hypothetical protein CGRA01v4_10830 [Colletotrichum graminicola]